MFLEFALSLHHYPCLHCCLKTQLQMRTWSLGHWLPTWWYPGLPYGQLVRPLKEEADVCGDRTVIYHQALDPRAHQPCNHRENTKVILRIDGGVAPESMVHAGASEQGGAPTQKKTIFWGREDPPPQKTGLQEALLVWGPKISHLPLDSVLPLPECLLSKPVKCESIY